MGIKADLNETIDKIDVDIIYTKVCPAKILALNRVARLKDLGA